MNEREIVELFSKLIKIIAIVLSFFSCSGEPPQVLEVLWHLNLKDDVESGEKFESLSIFIHATDEDGDEDIDQIYLIQDELQMFWNIPSDKWTLHIEQSVRWIGFNDLRAPGDGIFPEGNYRVLIIDLGGERAEHSFYLRNNIPEEEDITPLDVSFNNDTVSVVSEYPKFQMWFYDLDGKLIDKSKDLLMGSYQWNEVVRNINRRSFSFSVYTEPETSSWGMISGSYYFDN